MTILYETYGICKAIIAHPIRKNIQDLIEDLNKSQENKTDRSHFGYLARNRNLEFLGYLVTNIQSDEIKRIMPLDNFIPLTETEVETFEKAHNLILNINKKCFSNLFKVFPNSELALNTYFKFPYNFNSKPKNDFPELDDKILNLVNAFEKHSGYSFIKKIINKFPKIKEISQEQLLNTMIAYSRDYLIREPKLLSNDASQILELLRRKNAPSDLLKITFALFFLRISIKNLNKFIYLSFFKDKLPVLDNNNVFHIKSNYQNMFGKFLDLECQPNMSLVFANPGEPILVKIDTGDYKIDSTYFISGSSSSFLAELGDKQEFNLREMDDELNIISTNHFY